MAAQQDGVEIEDVAEENPNAIIRVGIDPITAFLVFMHGKLPLAWLKGDQVKSCVKFLSAMYKAFIALDASMVEINPLVLTKEGKILPLMLK